MATAPSLNNSYHRDRPNSSQTRGLRSINVVIDVRRGGGRDMAGPGPDLCGLGGQHHFEQRGLVGDGPPDGFILVLLLAQL